MDKWRPGGIMGNMLGVMVGSAWSWGGSNWGHEGPGVCHGPHTIYLYMAND